MCKWCGTIGWEQHTNRLLAIFWVELVPLSVGRLVIFDQGALSKLRSNLVDACVSQWLWGLVTWRGKPYWLWSRGCRMLVLTALRRGRRLYQSYFCGIVDCCILVWMGWLRVCWRLDQGKTMGHKPLFWFHWPISWSWLDFACNSVFGDASSIFRTQRKFLTNMATCLAPQKNLWILGCCGRGCVRCGNHILRGVCWRQGWPHVMIVWEVRWDDLLSWDF